MALFKTIRKAINLRMIPVLIFLISLLILFSAVQVTAQKISKKDVSPTNIYADEEESIENFQFNQSDLDMIRSEWNMNLEELRKNVPSFIFGLVAAQRMNILIDNISVGIVMNDGFMEDMVLGKVEEPTLRISTSKETFDLLMNSDNPLKDLNTVLKEGRLKYESLTFGNRLRLFFGKLAVRIFA